MKPPLVTVAIPSFNRPDDLNRILSNMINQSYRELEILVVDDCSTDSRVMDVISKFIKLDSRVRVIMNNENHGVLKNAKNALDNAIGEFFCWVGNDDWRGPQFIELLMEKMMSDNNEKFVFCNYREVYENGTLAPNYPRTHIPYFKLYANANKYIRIISYYWQDSRFGKHNLFYGLYKTNVLRKLDLNFLSQNFTNLAMDNFIVLSALQKNSLYLLNETLCTLTCSNKKFYLNDTLPNKKIFSFIFKTIAYVRSEIINHFQSTKIVDSYLLKIAFQVLFFPKLIKDLSGRIFDKWISRPILKALLEINTLRNFIRHLDDYLTFSGVPWDQDPIDKKAIMDILSSEKMSKKNNMRLNECDFKLTLNNVTLIAITTVEVERHAMALRYSCNNINYSSVKLISNYRPWNLVDGIDHVHISRDVIKGIDDWCKFVVYDLHKHVDTEYVLLVHADGFVVNPHLWTEDFLSYDYIGAPWPLPKDDFTYRDDRGILSRVGNSVSIRSAKLLKLPSELNLPWEPFHGLYHEDGFLCVKHKKNLENYGIKFSGIEAAKYFSHEKMIPEVRELKPFAFHKWAGKNSAYPKFSAY